jgi:hypothetical protein
MPQEKPPLRAKRIHATARSRVGHEVVTTRGDIVTEDLEETEIRNRKSENSGARAATHRLLKCAEESR